MTIFWRLVLSHLLSDFTLQFDIVNRLKRQGAWGMLLHCLTHFVVSVALTWSYLGDTWFHLGPVGVNGWWALTLMFAVHYGVDELRVYSMKSWYKDNTLSFLVDQVLHLYVLLLISPAEVTAGGGYLGEKWVMLACALVLVTDFTTVLVYFLEKDVFGKAFPHFDEKYFLTFERVVLWAFFFVAGYWWIPFALAWTVQILYVRRKRILDMSRMNVVLNIVLAAAFGLWARYLYYGGL
jgi:hypothetical protein